MGQFSLRIPDDLHTKARVAAAYENISLNEFCSKAVAEAVLHWEEEYGEIKILR